MAFERFKREMRKLDINGLNTELQKRKQLLFQWNNPIERRPDVIGTVPGTKLLRIKPKHPYYKIKKEIAIIHTFIHEMQLKVLQRGR